MLNCYSRGQLDEVCPGHLRVLSLDWLQQRQPFGEPCISAVLDLRLEADAATNSARNNSRRGGK
jgi:hypothetical protein